MWNQHILFGADWSHGLDIRQQKTPEALKCPLNAEANQSTHGSWQMSMNQLLLLPLNFGQDMSLSEINAKSCSQAAQVQVPIYLQMVLSLIFHFLI